MSEIKNVGKTWMALYIFKCNCVTPLHFKGLIASTFIRSGYNTAQNTFSTVQMLSIGGDEETSPFQSIAILLRV